MSSGNATVAPDGVCVKIDRDHAEFVAEHFYGRLSDALPAFETLRTREDVEAVEARIVEIRPYLESLGWGDPDDDVTLAYGAEDLRALGWELLETGASMVRDACEHGGRTAEENRLRYVDGIAAGRSILDQLDQLQES